MGCGRTGRDAATPQTMLDCRVAYLAEKVAAAAERNPKRLAAALLDAADETRLVFPTAAPAGPVVAVEGVLAAGGPHVEMRVARDGLLTVTGAWGLTCAVRRTQLDRCRIGLLFDAVDRQVRSTGPLN